MKTCNGCGERKTPEEFHRRGDGLQPRCKSCRKVDNAQFYRDNGHRSQESRRSSREAKMAWYVALKDGPCTDCGGRFHPAAMQWDHLPEHEKSFTISQALVRRSRAAILAEIAKCELVCANCHAVRTWASDRVAFWRAVSSVD